MRWFIAALVVCVLAAGCPKGMDVPLPSTKKGWGVVLIVVGASWLVAGGLIAAESDQSAGKRIGYSLGAGAIGSLLILGGWELGDFGSKPAPGPGRVPPPAAP